jgi:hypothetical protein
MIWQVCDMNNFSNREKITWHLTMLEGLVEEEREAFEQIIEGLNLRIQLLKRRSRPHQKIVLESSRD